MTYERQIKSARKLIDRKGGFVTYKSIVGNAPANPLEPLRASADTVTEHQVKMAIVPYDVLTSDRRTDFTSDGAVTSKFQGFLAVQGLAFIPSNKDTITQNDVTYKIHSFDLYDPNGLEPIVYIMQLGI